MRSKTFQKTRRVWWGVLLIVLGITMALLSTLAWSASVNVVRIVGVALFAIGNALVVPVAMKQSMHEADELGDGASGTATRGGTGIRGGHPVGSKNSSGGESGE